MTNTTIHSRSCYRECNQSSTAFKFFCHRVIRTECHRQQRLRPSLPSYLYYLFYVTCRCSSCLVQFEQKSCIRNPILHFDKYSLQTFFSHSVWHIVFNARCTDTKVVANIATSQQLFGNLSTPFQMFISAAIGSNSIGLTIEFLFFDVLHLAFQTPQNE